MADLQEDIPQSEGASVIQPPVSSSPQSGSPFRRTRTNFRENRTITMPIPNDASIPMPLPVSYALPNTSDVHKTDPKANPESVLQKYKLVSISDLQKSKADAEKSLATGVNDKSNDKATDVVSAKAISDVQKPNSKDKKSKAGDVLKVPVVENDKEPVVEKAKVQAKAPVVDNDKEPFVKKAKIQAKALVVENDKEPVVKKAKVQAKAKVVEKDTTKVVKAGDVQKSKAGDVQKSKAEKSRVSKSKDKATDVVSAKATGDVKKSKAADVLKAMPNVQKPNSKAALSKPDVLKSKVDASKRKRKLSDKEDSGEPKLSKKLKHNKLNKGKRVLYSCSSSVSTDEVNSDSSDEGVILMKNVKSNKRLKRKNVTGGSNVNTNKLLKKLLTGDDDDADSLKLMLKKLKGVINEVSDSEDEGVVRKSKMEVKKAKLQEQEQLEYLEKFPNLRVRNAPCSLFSSIRQSKVNMERFLHEIGFKSFLRIFIDQLPSKLGRFVAANFVTATNKLNLLNGLSIHVTPELIHDMLGIPLGGTPLFSFEQRSVKDDFVKAWVNQFYPKSFKDIRNSDIATELVNAKKVDDFFKLNFLMLFSNTMGRCENMNGQLCLDVVRHIPENLPISEIDWCGYIHNCLQYNTNPQGQCNYTGPLTVLMLVYLDSTKFEKFHVVRMRPAILNWSTTLMRQRMELELAERKLGCLQLNPEWTEAEAKESEGFIDAGLSESSDKQVLFNKIQEKLSIMYSERHSLEAELVEAYKKYADDEKFGELYEKYSELFKKPVSLGEMGGDDPGSDNNDDENGGSDNDDSGNDRDSRKEEKEVNSQSEKGVDIPADSEKPTENVVGVEDPVQGEKEADIVEPAEDYELEINSTPETYTQWLYNNADLVNEGDTFDKGTREELVVPNADPATPERVATRASKGSPEIILPEKRVVKPSSFLCSPYMNKKTKVVPRITKVEFMVGNSLFSMQGDKIETIFETRSGIKVSSIRLNMETLAPGLCLDANVIDCWGAILNHEESFKDVGSLSRHFFPTGCITTQMLDGSLDSEGQWKSFEAQVSGHFKDVDGIDLKDIDLKDMFARHLKLHCHKRYASIKKLNAKIPRLKWSTRSNYRDCGVFAMLHMESYMGEAPSKWDCGLVAESKEQFDMLRRLRFKFATKMLLHELNVHREKMLDEAKEFDKLDSEVKMEIIVQARMNRKQREEKNEEELEAN
ncbi:hypothetical protein CTI12_AA097680 [Artemisia annua]|uniref:Ulp1 protease family, C-terminal catalytic domain-containing protein n=1 Tax=Artemisia annua TaxID=35608 RepID=A0A2U1PYH5_ARTAN|nr:hypothetical protein CTI12_AA097680 [Artemisia annua]